MTTKGRRWNQNPQLNRTTARMVASSKSAIDEGTASADGSSADAGVQAERYQGITTGTAIQFPNGVDSSEKMSVFLMLQNEL